MKQLKTKDNIHFEEPLSELVSFRISQKEFIQTDAVARNNYISYSELIRNLIRDHIHEYAISENLRITLKISNKIDAILLEKRIISSRNDSNLSKMREILIDFEGFLDEKKSNISDIEMKNRVSELNALMQLIYEENKNLFLKLDKQYRRLMKNKALKRLNV